jgi:DNA-binding winged helix-turn-helix (wHTH) protein/tetratricopeptide (TPR) repeat protein
MPAEPVRTSGVVRFGVFEADLSAGELRRDGRKVKLQDRPFEILGILLERPGEIITREEFRQRLWPADTFVDFDHSLNASINKLRQALDDAAGNARFVETAGRRGYRFIAPVHRPGVVNAASGLALPAEPLASSSQPVGMSAAAPPPTASPSIPSTPPRPHRRLRTLIAAVAILSVAAVVAAWLLSVRSSRPAQVLTNRDSILLAEFDNRTGDPVFDDTLKQALAIQLEQSPFLNLVPDERVREVLGFMGRSPDTRLTPSLALEMCQREAIKALLASSIASLGRHYVISLNAVNCRDGASLVREQVEAESKEQVLHVLGTAAADLRGRLGETLSSIQKFDAPIEEATTPSLPAMKAFTLAGDRRAKGQEAEAIPFFERAIALDPNFAMAHARLGTLYANIDEVVRGSEYLRKAYQLRSRVSEPERLYITARYFDVVEGDLEKSVQNYELWTEVYPKDWRPFNNLAVACLAIGCNDKAESAARQARQLHPTHVFPHSNLAEALMVLGRLDEAKRVGEEAIAAHFENVGLRVILYQIAFTQGDAESMRRHVSWSRDKTRAGDMMFAEAQAAAAIGKLKEARQLFAAAVSSAQTHGFAENAATSAALQALVEVEFGRVDAGRAQARAALRLGTGHAEQGIAAVALARAGEAPLARQIADDLSKRFPASTVATYIRIPLILSAVEIAGGNPSHAVEMLRPPIPFEWGVDADFVPSYLRGQAFLKAGSGADAAREFQDIIDRRGVDPTSPLISLARLGLARSFRAAGDPARSRQSYEEFLALWKDADPDLPILQQARSEYARTAT